MLNLAWPWMLFLLPAPLLVRLLLRPLATATPALRSRLYTEAAAGTASGKTGGRKGLILILLGLAWIALIAAATRPQWIGDPIAIPASGRDLMVAVDFSGSMKIEDMIVDNETYPRVDVVKKVVGDFLKTRTGDRIGLIVFGAQAYLHAPLTFDHNTVATLLNEMQLDFVDPSTAIGDAIGLAVKRLQDRPENSRVLILLSDGGDNASQVSPAKASELAAQYGVKIYTVGLGAGPMVQRGWFGSRTVNPSGDLDEETLQAIADKTGGRYFRARDPAELEAIYATLDELEPVTQEEEVLRPTKALFYWPLGLAFGILLLAFAVRHTRVGHG